MGGALLEDGTSDDSDATVSAILFYANTSPTVLAALLYVRRCLRALSTTLSFGRRRLVSVKPRLLRIPSMSLR
jgi:hypothetical protein